MPALVKPVSGQQVPLHKVYRDVLFIQNHIEIQAGTPLLIAQQHISDGAGKFRSLYLPGIELNVSYTYNAHRNFGIKGGAKIGLLFTGYQFNLKEHEGWEHAGQDRGVLMAIPNLGLFALMVPRVMLPNGHFLAAPLGMQMTLYPGISSSVRYQHENEQGLNESNVLIESELNANVPRFSGIISLYYNHVMKNGNAISLGSEYRIGQHDFFSGEYRFMNGAQTQGNGTFSASESTLSIKVGYIFTRASATLDNVSRLSSR